MKGQPLRFIHGHNGRKRIEYLEEDRGFTTPCWIWQKAISRGSGYGAAYDREAGRQVLAHRKFYTDHVGPIPDGLHIDHLCGIKPCVNPDHLEPVTCKENLRRGKGCKVTQGQVREICLRYLAGESARSLAAEFGTDERSVHAYARGAEAVLAKH